MMDDDDRPGLDPALFDRLWDERHTPKYYMGMRVFPFDAQAARMERFIPLKLLFFWLDKLPHPRDCVSDLKLFALAQRHIRIGHLKTHGPAWRYVPEVFEHTESVEVIENGKVTGQAWVTELIHTEAEEPDNPLIDIHDFATWFQEANPEFLRLPAGFPGAAGEGPDAPERVERDPEAADPQEATGDLPEPDWLTLRELAGAFQGLRQWDEVNWLKNLRNNESPWIDGAIRRAGKQGRGRRSTGNPVTLARNLLALEVATGSDRAALIRELDQCFERPPLVQWRAVWRRERGRL